MDPLSITVSALTLAAGIGKLSVSITTFIREVRDARQDLDTVMRELVSLRTTLEMLAHDTADPRPADLPDSLTVQIRGILSGCNSVIDKITECLSKYNRDTLMKNGKWALHGRSDMDKLRSSLEAYKTALAIALDMVALTITREIKKDTTEIKVDMSQMKDSMGAIKDDTGEIRELVLRLEKLQAFGIQPGVQDQFLLRRYLDGLTTYAGSVYEESVVGLSERRQSPNGSAKMSLKDDASIALAKAKRANLSDRMRRVLDLDLRRIREDTEAAEVVELLKMGADPNAQWPCTLTHLPNRTQNNEPDLEPIRLPLQNAVFVGNLNCTVALLRFGALVDQVPIKDDWHYWSAAAPSLHVAAPSLQIAAATGRQNTIAMIDLLVAEGADVNAIGEEVGTPLQCCVMFGPDDSAKVSIVKHLLLLGANPNLRPALDSPKQFPKFVRWNQWNRPVLFNAMELVMRNSPDTHLGAPTCLTSLGRWPDTVYISPIHLEIVEVLLSNHADCDARESGSGNGLPLLMWVTQYRLHTMMELLFQHCANATLAFHDGSMGFSNPRTALHQAARNLDHRGIQILMRHGALPCVHLSDAFGLPIHAVILMLCSIVHTGSRELELEYFPIRFDGSSMNLWHKELRRIQRHLGGLFDVLSLQGELYDTRVKIECGPDVPRKSGFERGECLSPRELARKIFLPDTVDRRWLFPFAYEN